MLPKTGGERRCSAPAGKCGRDGKRGPSCGARRGRRRAQPPRPCRPLRQKILAAPAAAAGREANSVSNASRAVRPGRKTRPLLRCPARPSAGAAASALPTAAPKDSCCTCRGGGERSELCFKCFQGSAAGTESAAPLAVPGAAIGGRSRLGLADRCAKRFLLHLPRRRGEKRTLFQTLPGQCGRDGKRGPSCGARRGHRRAQPPRPCRPQRQKVLAVSATGGARTFCPRLPALGSKSGEQSEKPRTFVRGPTGAPAKICEAKFCGEKEPQQNERAAIFAKRIAASDIPLAATWRRRRDLNPRAGFPTYALSRGASSTS